MIMTRSEIINGLRTEIERAQQRGDAYLDMVDVRVLEAAAKEIADAAPVVHGKWLGRRYDFKEYKYVIVPYDATTFDNPNDLFCSVCNEPALSDGAENDVPSNFCPHCGARMDA